MEAFRELYQVYGAELTALALLLSTLALIGVAVQGFRCRRQSASGSGTDDATRQSTLLTGLRRLAQQNNDRLAEVERALEELQGALARKAGRIGIVRFNPFQETGGDQSFSVALLDDEGNGVVITSLYSRDGTRIYAKPIQRGQSPYPLAEEEVEALRRAQAFRQSDS